MEEWNIHSYAQDVTKNIKWVNVHFSARGCFFNGRSIHRRWWKPSRRMQRCGKGWTSFPLGASVERYNTLNVPKMLCAGSSWYGYDWFLHFSVSWSSHVSVVDVSDHISPKFSSGQYQMGASVVTPPLTTVFLICISRVRRVVLDGFPTWKNASVYGSGPGFARICRFGDAGSVVGCCVAVV